MASGDDIIQLHAHEHDLVGWDRFETLERYCLYLIHKKAYEEATLLSHGKVVLDLGCNTGYGTRMIAKRCEAITGVDVSPRAIEEARAKFGAENITYQVVEGGRLPFEDASFDVVVNFQVLEHVEDPGAFLADIKRVLGPGGTGIFTTPNARIRLDPGMKPWNRFHVREFSAPELADLLGLHFPEVVVRGLFGKEALYSVEYNRVQEALGRARRKAAGNRTLGERFSSFFRRRLQKVKRRRPLEPHVMKRFSTADLFYRDEDLEGSLDLMAICQRGGGGRD